jgi:glyoxylase-like metal-dependent hydrolase (beta-lactamase superfamily II)
MELVPIHPGMFLIPAANEGRFPYAHAVLVDSGVVCLIDAGCGLHALEQVQDIASPDFIIASHSHPDHISGCWMFEDVPIHAPSLSGKTFGQLDRMAEQYAEPGPLAEAFKSYVQGSIGFESCLPTHRYDAGASFDLGQSRLVAIHAPGHSDDHMCFFDTASGILLSGDVDLTVFGPFYGHRESDITQLLDTLQTLMDLEPRVVVSSHQGVIKDDIQGRFQRYRDIITMRHGAIAELLRHERTLDELVALSPIYRTRPIAPALTRYWETQMIQKHIDLLVLEGRVQKTSKGYVVRKG